MMLFLGQFSGVRNFQWIIAAYSVDASFSELPSLYCIYIYIYAYIYMYIYINLGLYQYQ